MTFPEMAEDFCRECREFAENFGPPTGERTLRRSYPMPGGTIGTFDNWLAIRRRVNERIPNGFQIVWRCEAGRLLFEGSAPVPRSKSATLRFRGGIR